MKKKTKRRWSKYLIELLIVIIGISIAFWLNNVAEEHNIKKQRTTYLTDITNDLNRDNLLLSRNIRDNLIKNKALNKSLQLIKESAPIDSILINIIKIGDYNFFKPDNLTLKSLIQSGDLKLVNSGKTKRELLRLLKIYDGIDEIQNNFLDALDENYFPMLISKMDMAEFKVVDRAFFYGIEIKNYCIFTIEETNRHIKNYTFAQNQIRKVMQLIEKDLNN